MNLFVALLSIISLLTAQASYDWTLGNTSIWLSAAAYCETNTYLTRTYKGYSAGFVATHVIDDATEDVQGIIGYLPTQKSIYVTFRGSSSISDWLNNIDVILTDYPKCNKCEIHKGFYKAQQSVIKFITEAVQSLRVIYPDYTTVVTGHSLGAAMATLTTLDFMDSSISPIRLVHFGSPRVGNDEFAEYASNRIADRNRNTHHKDMVPHIPMHERFTHISGEWYEDYSGLHQCNGYEDPKCSYQWHITNIDDHMHYLGLYVGCDAVSSEETQIILI